MDTTEKALRFLRPDESARAYLERALTEPLASGIPWLDARAPEPALRPGEIIEIVGQGGSGKTEIALEIATNAVLPAERRGVRYRGSEARVIFIDCDGKFDQLRLLRVLNQKITDRLGTSVAENKRESMVDEVYEESMSRFTLIRAHSSLDVLKTLTALDAAWDGKIARAATDGRFGESKAETTTTTTTTTATATTTTTNRPGGNGGVGKSSQRLVICDNVAAFYWLDRASRKDHEAPYNIQRVFANEARLLKRLASAHRASVLVTKNTLSGDARRVGEYKDFLPVEWTNAVTQRIVLTPSSSQAAGYGEFVGVASWDAPRRPGGTFTVTERGMRC